MKHIIILLLFPCFLSAQTRRLNSCIDPTIAKKTDVATVANVVNGVLTYAQAIEQRRATDSLVLLNKFIADSTMNKRRADSIKNDVAARMRIDTANAAIARMLQTIAQGDSTTLVTTISRLKADSSAKTVRIDSLAAALPSKADGSILTRFTNDSAAKNTAIAGKVNSSTYTAGLGGKVNNSDTAAMLSPYAKSAALNAVSALIPSVAGLLQANTAAATYATNTALTNTAATKLNVSDSATMLLPYLRSNVASSIYATSATVNAGLNNKLNIADSGRAPAQYVTGGSLRKVEDSLNAINAAVKLSMDSLKNLQVLKTSGAAPTITLAAGAGTGATASIVGNNVAGKITLNTGASLLAIGKIMTLTFANGMTYPNGCTITFVAGDANSAPFMTKLFAASSPTGIDLSVTATALSVLTTYTGYYHIIGY